MSGIGKIVQTAIKQIDASDISKIANSNQVKNAVSDTACDIGEALANGVSKKSTDIASTIVEETTQAAQTKTASSSGFFSKIWNKLFHSSKNKTASSLAAANVSSKNTSSMQLSAEELQEQIAKCEKQIKSLTKENKSLKSSVKSVKKENKNLKSSIKSTTKENNAYKQNVTPEQQKQVDVDCMNWFQKLFSSKCKFNWNNFKWEAS